MRLFRRKSTAADPPDPRTAWPEQHVPEDAAVAAETFWQGWYDLLPMVSAALGEGEPHRVEHELCQLVEALHPRLHFSLERGRRSIYALVVTGQEDPELRPFTDAWRATAPPDDAIWEYHDSVPPVPDPTEVTVNLGEHRISLADVRVVAQVEDDVVDVAVFHPGFRDLDEAARQTMTFLPLDATLGERLAAERLRRVETAETEPTGAITLLEFRELVRGLGGGTSGNVGAAD
ncbi:hypothetical protein ACGFMK_12385 [Amycolatopsis sp. NPDC049252]|uniref:hypothetical protein n=1 Tax=Amycolatopsis sp. NPDC049252 TaxID=3363933 RepID=UPI00370FFF28